MSHLPLEPVLRASSPGEGMLDRVRKLYQIEAQVGGVSLGLGATIDSGEIRLAYPMTMIVWRHAALSDRARDELPRGRNR